MAKYEYETEFHLTNPVNDYDAAARYLKDDDMAPYLRDSIDSDKKQCEDFGLSSDDIESVEWDLENDFSGVIRVVTKAEMSNQAIDYISDWIKGQCSDGLGEGFEQQDFAEIYDEDEWGQPDPDTYDMASFDWDSNDYTLDLVRTYESKSLKEASDLTHLFKVGQKVSVRNDDFDAMGDKFALGTVTKVFPDHIIVDVPSVSDHMYFDADMLGAVYPEYNFKENKAMGEDGNVKNNVLACHFVFDEELHGPAYIKTKKWLESLDISDWVDGVVQFPKAMIKYAKIVVDDGGFVFKVYTTTDLTIVDKNYLTDMEDAIEVYVFNEIEPVWQEQPFGQEVIKHRMYSKPNLKEVTNESISKAVRFLKHSLDNSVVCSNKKRSGATRSVLEAKYTDDTEEWKSELEPLLNRNFKDVEGYCDVDSVYFSGAAKPNTHVTFALDIEPGKYMELAVSKRNGDQIAHKSVQADDIDWCKDTLGGWASAINSFSRLVDSKNLFEATDPTEGSPLKVAAPKGDYWIWKTGDTIYGSVNKPKPNQNIVNARSIVDFTSQGFNDVDEVVAYVKKYF